VAQSSPSTAPAQAPAQSRAITAVTRRDIFDFLRAETDPWWGRLSETGFLGQLYDLDALPSTDPRHATAGEDIARHRVANFDWDDDWVSTIRDSSSPTGLTRFCWTSSPIWPTPWSSPTPTRPHGW
jgi:hypothetical protein